MASTNHSNNKTPANWQRLDLRALLSYLRDQPIRRLLVLGAHSQSQADFITECARTMTSQNHCYGLCADPGSPLFGIPGTVGLARFEDPDWQLMEFEAICSLDAARFRLPLLRGVNQLLERSPARPLLLLTPKLVSGVAAAELLQGLAELMTPDALLLTDDIELPLGLKQEINALQLPCLVLTSTSGIAPEQESRTFQHKCQWRSQLWQRFLQQAKNLNISLAPYQCLGTPPPQSQPDAWQGRQIAFVGQGQTQAMGQIVSVNRQHMQILVNGRPEKANHIVVRDACVNDAGLLKTAPRHSKAVKHQSKPIPSICGPFRRETIAGSSIPQNGNGGATLQIGRLAATLVNGVYGDPLLHLQLLNKRRGLLFDLGEATLLPVKQAHQISDVFISHGHMDHIFGFLSLLRSRMGVTNCCRLYGPRGLVKMVNGLLNGFLWDRIGDNGPRFEVNEFDGKKLYSFKLQAGKPGYQFINAKTTNDGVLLSDKHCQISAIELDHGTPVLAYALETPTQKKVNRQALETSGLTAGPWLRQLIDALFAHQLEQLISLPSGEQQQVQVLADQFIHQSPGLKMVYATDFADNSTNRQRLTAFARHADVLFCEANFMNADKARALPNGHLTTRACGEIARDAGITTLVPFHFSKRYEHKVSAVYREIRAIFPQALDLTVTLKIKKLS